MKNEAGLPQIGIIALSIVILFLTLQLPNSHGAPLDSDQDGIMDSVDKCIDVKEDFFGSERFDGCPDPPQNTPPVKMQESTSTTEITSSEQRASSEQPVAAQDSISEAIDTVQMLQVGIPNISDIKFTDYFERIVSTITNESSIYDLVAFSIGMVIYGIFIFHFYRFLAKKDMFSLKIEQRLVSSKFKSSGEKISTAPRVAAYIVTNVFAFPIVIFVWFLIYSMFMFFLAQDMSISTVFLVSSSLIIAVRIAAYYNEDLAKDLAKLLPFALLGIFLLSPTFFSIDEVKERLYEIPQFVIQIAAFLLVAIVIETILSILYLIKIKFFGHKEKKQKMADSEQPV